MLCKTFSGLSYVTDYFIIRLTGDEALNIFDLQLMKRKRKLALAIADDFMRLYAEDQFRNGKWN